MALGDGGLDAQVEQRMDAYRGNPTKAPTTLWTE